ncbi:MAG: AMP-binding protein [Actinophytocola sp.]|nr:AMP-binding protein [Actinophytocola sp.]
MANVTRDLVEHAPPGHIALVTIDAAHRRRAWTFGELADGARATAARFAALGVRRGDVVYTLCGSRSEWVLTMLACLRMGAVMAPCSPMLRAEDLRVRARTAVPRLVVADDQYLDVLADAGLDGNVLPLSAWGAGDAGSDVPPAPDLPEDDPAFLLFTSGSTGTPKPVWHGQRYVWGQRLQAEHWLGARPGDIVWSTAAPGWSKSTRNAFLAPWLMGAVAVLHEARFDVEQRMATVRDEGVTVLCMSPTEWRMLLAAGDPPALPSLRRLVAAGEPLDKETIARWRAATGLTIADGYGQTETGHIAGAPPDADAPPGSAGRPLPGVATRLHDGELQVDATTLPTLSLVPEPELVDGRWWPTGDLFQQDDDGWLFFQSRVDDVILSSGYRIDPVEVETALRSHSAVRDCLVAGIPDAQRGEVVAALVVVGGDAGDALADLAAALQDHVRTVTAPYKYPRVIRFVDALPRTTTGKAARGKGRELLAGE